MATRDEVIENIDTLQVSIQAGVTQSLLSGENDAAASAIKQKLKALAGVESGVLLSFNEPVTLGPGLGATRTTVLPLSRKGELPSSGVAVLAESIAGADPVTLAKLLTSLAKVDHDMDLRILQRDNFIPLTVGTFSLSGTRSIAPPAASAPSGASMNPDLSSVPNLVGGGP